MKSSSLPRLLLTCLAASLLPPSSASADLVVYYIAPSSTQIPGIPGQSLNGLYQSSLRSPAGNLIAIESIIEDGTTNELGHPFAERTRFARLFTNPESGELKLIGITSRTWFVPAASIVFELPKCTQDEAPEFEQINFPPEWRESKSGPRSIQVRSKQPTSPLTLEFQTSLPTTDFSQIRPDNSSFLTGEDHSPDWVARPDLLARSAVYDFPSQTVILPLDSGIHRLGPHDAITILSPDFTPFEGFGPRKVGKTRNLCSHPLTGEIFLPSQRLAYESYLFHSALNLTNPDCGATRQISPPTFRLREIGHTTLIARIRSDGSEPTMFELPPGSLGPNNQVPDFEHLAIDPYAGLLFVSDKQNGRILRKPLARLDSSYSAILDLSQTNRADFDFEIIPGNYPNVIRIHTDPVEKRLYWLGTDRMLRSMRYDGSEIAEHFQMPAGTLDFVLSNHSSPPPASSPRFATFSLTEALPLGNHRSFHTAVSADGRFIFGNSDSGDPTAVFPGTKRSQAMFRALEGPAQGIGFPLKGNTDSSNYTSTVRAASGDGKTLLVFGNAPGVGTAFSLWTAAQGHRLGTSFPNGFLDNPRSLNGDGNTLAGQHAGQPALWNAMSGPVAVAKPAARSDSGILHSISANGLVAAGEATGSGATEAFRWSSTEGALPLGDLPGGSFSSRALAISPNGEYITGDSVTGTTDFGDETSAFFHSQDLGMVEIPPLASLPPFPDSAEGRAVSNFGVVAGTSNGRAFLWHPLTGTVDLKTFCENAYGMNFNGADLIAANGISADGTVIVGDARDDTPRLRGFTITLPAFPADQLFLLRSLDPGVDSDGDGRNDLSEVMLGSDPYKPDAPPSLLLENDASVYRIFYRKPAIAAMGGVSYLIETSTDLSEWTSDGVILSENSATTLRAEFPADINPRFFRLKAFPAD